MSDSLKSTLFDRLDSLTAGMLSAPGAPPRPMAQQIVDGEQVLWFITADGTDIAKAADRGEDARFIAACDKTQIYASIDGQLSIERDPQKLDQVWSPIAAVWFEEGRQDDDIRLVRMTPASAEVWATDGNAKTLYEFARASLQGDTPDVDTHGKLAF